MPSDRTDKFYDWWKQAAEKYDYFMAGVCLAITSYFGQNLEADLLGLNASTLEVVSVLFFAAASFCALKRIQTTSHLLRLQVSGAEEAEKHSRALEALHHDAPVLGELTRKPVPPAELQQRADAYAERRKIVEAQSKKVNDRASLYFAARDNLLIVGFVLVVIARVWAGQSSAPASSGSPSHSETPGGTQADEPHHGAAPPNPSLQRTPPEYS